MCMLRPRPSRPSSLFEITFDLEANQRYCFTRLDLLTPSTLSYDSAVFFWEGWGWKCSRKKKDIPKFVPCVGLFFSQKLSTKSLSLVYHTYVQTNTFERNILAKSVNISTPNSVSFYKSKGYIKCTLERHRSLKER